jgi:hypothetical protein
LATDLRIGRLERRQQKQQSADDHCLPPASRSNTCCAKTHPLQSPNVVAEGVAMTVSGGVRGPGSFLPLGKHRSRRAQRFLSIQLFLPRKSPHLNSGYMWYAESCPAIIGGTRGPLAGGHMKIESGRRSVDVACRG